MSSASTASSAPVVTATESKIPSWAIRDFLASRGSSSETNKSNNNNNITSAHDMLCRRRAVLIETDSDDDGDGAFIDIDVVGDAAALGRGEAHQQSASTISGLSHDAVEIEIAPASSNASAAAASAAAAAASSIIEDMDKDDDDDTIPMNHDQPIFTCVACYCESLSGFRCSRCHSGLCGECLHAFVGQRIAAREVSPLVCFGDGCNAQLSIEGMRPALSQLQYKQLQRLVTLSSNKNWIECPKCDALNLRQGSPDMTCSKCDQQFCFYHGTLEFCVCVCLCVCLCVFVCVCVCSFFFLFHHFHLSFFIFTFLSSFLSFSFPFLFISFLFFLFYSLQQANQRLPFLDQPTKSNRLDTRGPALQAQAHFATHDRGHCNVEGHAHQDLPWLQATH